MLDDLELLPVVVSSLAWKRATCTEGPKGRTGVCSLSLL